MTLPAMPVRAPPHAIHFAEASSKGVLSLVRLSLVRLVLAPQAAVAREKRTCPNLPTPRLAWW